MKVKKKTVKRVVWGIVLLAIIWFLYITFSPPSYDNPLTPKATFGDPDATVQIVEFGDLQCPACRGAHFALEQVKSEYGDQISYQYFHFPLRTIHPFAQKASEAAECANDQGKFFDFVDIVYKNQQSIRVSDLKGYAGRLGLDQALFDACLDSGAKRDIVEIDVREGVARNIRGTPTFFLNDQLVEDWSFDNFKELIDAELAK